MRLPGNCQRCGACCYSDSDSYVPLTEHDRGRIGLDAGEMVRNDGTVGFMKMRDDHCIGLTLREGGFACALYDRRPEICRELERGSEPCREEFRLKKDRSLRALRSGDRGAALNDDERL